MDETLRTFRPPYHVPSLATLTFAAGAGGMVLSFLFLASAHPLDVMAGAAGFIAGAVLVAGGVVSFALRERASVSAQTTTPPALDYGRWLARGP